MRRLLLVSYETFRMYVGKFTKKNDICCDMLICDEAHRLKNADALTTKALASLACRRRVLLSGTPVQNDLDEFFAMADFTNPSVLGTAEDFRRRYKNPILVGREPDASQAERDRAKVLQNEMSSIVNQFIIRRMNSINAKFLPDKLVQIVCCRLTSTQQDIYRHLIGTKDVQSALGGKTKDALSYIQNLQKLCNHPKILELSCGGKTKGVSREELQLFGVPLDMPDHDEAAKNSISPDLSGKMMVLHNLLDVMWKDQTSKKPPDKMVVISIFTQTLDLVQRMCKGKKWPVVRLDGSMAVKKRMELVNTFNDPLNRNSFVFLLSSKAGGCGLNIIGANRLVLFDSDWNPATDKQAAARCWRDGQKKHCYTYRFLSAGTLEEKIFQRQLSKEGLAAVVEDKEQVNALSSNDLKDLFRFRENTPSDTHDKLKCTHCRLALDAGAEEVGLGESAIAFVDNLLDLCRALPEAADFVGGSIPKPMVDESGSGGGDSSSALTGSLLGSAEARSAAAAASVDATAATAAADKARSKAKMSDLSAISKKLHGGQFSKLTEFHRDMRQMFAASRKVFPEGSTQACNADAFREYFENLWAASSDEIMVLQSAGNGARVFSEAELAGAAADLHARSHAAPAASARPGKRHFTFPTKPSGGLLLPGGTKTSIGQGSGKENGSSSSSSSSSNSSSSSSSDRASTSTGGVDSRRSSLGPPFKPQHEMPKEEDLNNWSHHFSASTCDDEYLKKAVAGTDLVSFVFGLTVTWDLTQKQMGLDEEREAEDKIRREQELEVAKSRLGEKKGKTKKKAVEMDGAALCEAAIAGEKDDEASSEAWRLDYQGAGIVDAGTEADVEGERVAATAPKRKKSKKKVASKALSSNPGAESPLNSRLSAVDATGSESTVADVVNACSVCTFHNSPRAQRCKVPPPPLRLIWDQQSDYGN